MLFFLPTTGIVMVHGTVFDHTKQTLFKGVVELRPGSCFVGLGWIVNYQDTQLRKRTFEFNLESI